MARIILDRLVGKAIIAAANSDAPEMVAARQRLAELRALALDL